MDADLLDLFEDSLRRFNRERYAPAQRVAGVHGEAGTHWAEMAELGWFELAVADGGRPPLVPLLSLYRAAGEGLWREPISGVFGAAACIAALTPDAALRAHLGAGLATGTAPLAYADREPGSGPGLAPLRTIALPASSGERLSGAKVAVMDAADCAAFLVTASRAQDGRTVCYRVEREAPGLQLSHHPTVEGRCLTDLRLDDTPAQALCEASFRPATAAWVALLAAAECVGIMRGALGDTRDYLAQRRQFGRPLIEFQVLQHRLAEMAMLMRETDALLQQIADDLDAHDDAGAIAGNGASPCPRDLHALRAQVSRAVRHVTREAVQLHGGMGITQECRVSHYYRRALTLESLHGGQEWALAQLMPG